MTLTQIAIENFKGIGGRIEIPLRPITLLFGANSVGKSTILQALLYFRDLLEHENADADRLIASGAAIDLGGFRKFVHKHDVALPVRIELTFAPDDDGLPIYPVLGQDYRAQMEMEQPVVTSVSVEIEICWDEATQRPWITAYSIKLDGRAIGAIRALPNVRAELSGINLNHPCLKSDLESDEEDSPNLMALRSLFEDGELPNASIGDGVALPLQQHVVPRWGAALPLDFEILNLPEESQTQLPLAHSLLSSIFVGAGEVLRNELRRMRYLGPLRAVPSRGFIPQSSPSFERWADGSAAWDLLFRAAAGIGSTRLVEKVSDAIADPDGLNLGYRLEARHFYEVPSDGFVFNSRAALANAADEVNVEEHLKLVLEDLRSQPQGTRLTLIDLKKETAVSAVDVGNGVTQVIPIVVACLDSGASLLAVEQPELHTHPALQCALGDLFAREVEQFQDRIQLIETHSEHLLLRLLRRIRETAEGELPPNAPKLKPQHLSVLYVDSTSGGVEITKLPVNEEGDFDRQWPKGFFDERAKELF